jgi:TetR/AcrR family transcriptional repressor of uid operon
MPKVTEAYLEARRQEILDAAIACFTRKGFHQTTMDDICRQAALSPGAVYRYFASKEEIIDAAVRSHPSSDADDWPEYVRWVEEEVVRFDDFVKLVNTFNRIALQRYEEGSEAFEMAMQLRVRSWAEALQNTEVKEEILTRWENRLGLFEAMVRRAQELGQVNPELDPGAAGRVILALSEGFRLLWTVDPDFAAWASKFNDVEMALYSGTFFSGENGQAD